MSSSTSSTPATTTIPSQQAQNILLLELPGYVPEPAASVSPQPKLDLSKVIKAKVLISCGPIRQKNVKDSKDYEGWKEWKILRKDESQYDTYYRDPDGIYKFRSWPEVIAYKDHGIIPKGGPKDKDAPSATDSVESKQKKRKRNASAAAGADGKDESEAAPS